MDQNPKAYQRNPSVLMMEFSNFDTTRLKPEYDAR